VRRWPDNFANDDTPNTWGHASSWSDGPVIPSPADGTFHEPTNVQAPSTDPLFIQWVANLTSEPTAMPHGCHAAPRACDYFGLRGHSMAAGFPDLASNVAGIDLGFDWDCGAPFAGGMVVPLFNYLEPIPFPACSSFGGVELGLNPANGFLPFFRFLTAALDAQGVALGPKLHVPQQPGTAGQWMGLQGVVVDATFSTLRTTAAYWFLIR
jgi:hypothetical protein